MDLPASLIEGAAHELCAVGDVYKITMRREDGITPKDGYDTRDKFFVVLGFDGEGCAWGGVVVNSKINPRLPARINRCMLPISAAKYAFLRYDSYVNCYVIKTTHSHELLAGRRIGVMDEEDLRRVRAMLRESPGETTMRLKRFGLL